MLHSHVLLVVLLLLETHLLLELSAPAALLELGVRLIHLLLVLLMSKLSHAFRELDRTNVQTRHHRRGHHLEGGSLESHVGRVGLGDYRRTRLVEEIHVWDVRVTQVVQDRQVLLLDYVERLVRCRSWGSPIVKVVALISAVNIRLLINLGLLILSEGLVLIHRDLEVLLSMGRRGLHGRVRGALHFELKRLLVIRMRESVKFAHYVHFHCFLQFFRD
jgi:hypothetical protein